MIEIDPQDRLLHSSGPRRSISAAIALIVATVAILGVGIIYGSSRF
jgi:hypothetical protein